MMRVAGGVLVGLAALASVGWYFMADNGSGGSAAGELTAQEAPPRTEFAADRASDFDADRAMTYLKAICKIGPRVSGSDGMKRQQELLQKHFEDRGGRVEFQRFTARQRSRREPVEMANLIVSWHPDRQKRIILCSHYDTRPIADQERDRRNWTKPFLSANDGGSGVALLMELANHMKKLDTGVGVDFVFFDGEEYIFDPGGGERRGDKYFFGSEHFANAYRRDRPGHQYVAAVLLDMIAGKNARFPVENNSWQRAGALVQILWTIAAEQRCAAFVQQPGPDVLDDHLALNAAGIPAVDIIDFNYPHWHRLSDVPDNCSAASFDQVARVLVTWLKRLK
jgi:hypothetical protein